MIDEESIKKFYIENELNSEKQILSYIMGVMNLTGDAGNKKEPMSIYKIKTGFDDQLML